MADFGGFQAVTPQEMLAQIGQIRDQAIGSGDRDRVRQAIFGRTSDALFGNKRVQDAQKLQQTIAEASKQAAQGAAEGEDPMDTEARRLKTIRDALVDLDPAAASQINGKLLEIANMKFEKSRLMASDARAEGKYKIEQAAAADEAAMRKAMGGMTYTFNTQSGEAASWDLLDPSTSSGFNDASKQPGTIVLKPEDMLQLYRDKTAQAAALRASLARADNDTAGKNLVNNLEKASSGVLDLFGTADRLFSVLAENPDALTNVSTVNRKVDSVLTEIGAAANAVNGGKTKEGTDISGYMKSNSITNTRMQGLVVGLAYATAKANDGSGRISDADLKAALDQVGANNPNPAAILSNLNDIVTRSAVPLLDRLNTAPMLEKEALAPRMKLIQERYTQFTEKAAKYTRSRTGNPSGFPTPSAPKTPLDEKIDKILQGK